MFEVADDRRVLRKQKLSAIMHLIVREPRLSEDGQQNPAALVSDELILYLGKNED